MTETQMVSCIRFSMQLLISQSIFTIGWKKRKNFPVWLAAGFAGYWLAALLTFWGLKQIPAENPLVLIFYYFCLFSYSIFLMKCCFAVGFEELLFAGVCGYATQHIAFAAATVFWTLTGITLTGVSDFLLVRFLPYAAVTSLVYFCIAKKNAGRGELRRRDIRMVWLAFSILSIAIIISSLVDYKGIRGNSLLLQNVFCKIYAILCSFFAIFIAFYLSRENLMLREKETMESMLRAMSEKQRLSQETVNIINIKCHDLKYRISKISRIEDVKDQEEYIESVKNALSIYDNIFHTGNDALDLVLTEKSLLCSGYDIKMSAMADGGILNFIAAADVYALFGNLLDNAIESVQKEEDKEKRIISVLVSRRNGGVYIHVENYCAEPVEFEDGLPLTTKEEKACHGFGVRSIRYIAKKYQGSLLMRLEEERFLTDILFYPETQ